MRNRTSTISQDRLFSLEEFMKNATSTEKGKGKAGPRHPYWRNIHEDPFHSGDSKNRSVCSITNWDVMEKLFFKTGKVSNLTT